jgi:hypothetical protein
MSTLISVIKNIVMFVLWMVVSVTIIFAIVGNVAPVNNTGGAMLYGSLTLTCAPVISIVLYMIVMSKFVWNRKYTNEVYDAPRHMADENAPYGERI